MKSYECTHKEKLVKEKPRTMLLMGRIMKDVAQVMRVDSVVRWYDSGGEGEPPDVDTLSDEDLDFVCTMPGASSIDFAVRICAMQDIHTKDKKECVHGCRRPSDCLDCVWEDHEVMTKALKRIVEQPGISSLTAMSALAECHVEE